MKATIKLDIDDIKELKKAGDWIEPWCANSTASENWKKTKGASCE